MEQEKKNLEHVFLLLISLHAVLYICFNIYSYLHVHV